MDPARDQERPNAAPARTIATPLVVVVAGVSGAGKSTVGAALAKALGCDFVEGDSLHPPASVEKMRGGIPLTDADRMPWLDRVAAAIDGWRMQGASGVLACSALKRSYRRIIIGDRAGVTLVFLEGSPELIRRRMAARQGHYMPVSLLDSQFAALEAPQPDEHPVIVAIDGTPEAIMREILDRLAGRA